MNSIERLREILAEDYAIKNTSAWSFFSSEGVEFTEDTLILAKDGDIIYVEKNTGVGFDYNTILEQYNVLERLGKGGFGSVHRAQHKETGNVVAIKYIDITESCMLWIVLICSSLACYASKVDEIYREAQALKKLSHPGIVKLYHAFLWKNFVVLIMENVGGGELRKYINEKGAGEGLAEKEAREFFVQLTYAVDYCHNKSVIHRDLKPENILLVDAASKIIKVC